MELFEGVRLTLLRLVQFTTFIPVCDCTPGSCSCSNLVAKVVCSADGRGDEKEYQQKSQVHLNTSHAFSLLFSIPSIHKMLPSVAEEVVGLHQQQQNPPPECSCGGDTLQYDPQVVPSTLRQVVHVDTADIGDIRVWSIVENAPIEEFEAPTTGFCECQLGCDAIQHLQHAVQNMQEDILELEQQQGVHVQLQEAAGEDGRDQIEQLLLKIEKPRGYQKVGNPVWRDRTPSSHRAQRPWGLIHERESKEMVGDLVNTVIDPQILEMRNFKLSPCNDQPLDFKTEYWTLDRGDRGVQELSQVDKEQGAGKEVFVSVKEQRSVEDLKKPVIFISQPNGCITAISSDVQLKGMDSKLVEMINQRTGAYCYACDSTLQEAHKVERVKEGFFMNVSMDRLEQAVETLFTLHGVSEDEKEFFEFPSQPGDYNVRLGLKHSPLTSVLDATKIIAVLHTTKLRMFAFVTSLITRNASKCLQWGKGKLPPAAKERLEKTTLEWKSQHLGSLIGYRHKQAPNQITGHLVDTFMSEHNRSAVVQAIGELKGWRTAWRRQMGEEEKENIRSLLQRLKVIGSVVSSGQLVKVRLNCCTT